MGDFDYWLRQDGNALFEGIDVERPEQKRLAGKLAIVGGNAAAFFTVARMADWAVTDGVGEVRVVLPDSLQKKVPRGVSDLVFAGSSKSGGFGKKAAEVLPSVVAWADLVLWGGDFGRGSETAEVIAGALRESDGSMILTRDTIDLVTVAANEWIGKNGVILIATMSQLQKLLRSIYYPRMITLSMPLNQLVELLHKLTLSYDMTIMTYHSGQLVAAEAGRVVTMAIEKTKWTPIDLWNGELAVKVARLKMWNKTRTVLEVMATAWLK